MMKMKWILSSTLAGLMLMTAGSLALAEEKDEKDLSAYQWGYWDKMVSPAAGPVAPAGVTISTPPVSPPQPTPTPIPDSVEVFPSWARFSSPDTTTKLTGPGVNTADSKENKAVITGPGSK
jgi:hypothetical protein